MVEELLKFFIDKVDGDLLKAVVLKDLKAGNVKHSSEVGLFHGGVNEGLITLDNEPLEETIKSTSCDTTNTKGCLEEI